MQWTGYITEVHDDGFCTVNLIPEDHDGPELYAELFMADIIRDDRMGDLEEGSVITVFSEVRQKYLPPFTKEQLAEIEEKVRRHSEFWLKDTSDDERRVDEG